MRTLITAAALGLGIAASAQNSTDAMELLRSDIRTRKQAIVLANLGLNEQQSAVFAPINDEYTAALKAVWDKKLLLVKDYSTSYHGTMTEETAKSLLRRSDELEKEVLRVRGTYENEDDKGASGHRCGAMDPDRAALGPVDRPAARRSDALDAGHEVNRLLEGWSTRAGR